MRRALVILVLVAITQLGALARCRPDGVETTLIQEVVDQPSFVELHTPGSGAPEEMAVTSAVSGLLGPDPDLNRVTTLRTRLGDSPTPRAILVLVPGFLGGATSFDPLAQDLVERMNGALEVWAIDRRPNLLEDRLGALHAMQGATDPACTARPVQADCPIFQGTQFFFADADLNTPGDFPGNGDLDVDLDGELDPQRPLVDRFGVERLPLLVQQDDVRFMAHWGLDTYFRDWKRVVEEARARVGPTGVVLIGGHSQGTTWSSLWAAYDFDPNPSSVLAGHSLVDGLVLLEGGGAGPTDPQAPTLLEYEQTVADLERPGGPDVFLEQFSGIPIQQLGTSGEIAALAGFYQPFERSLIQRTPLFGGGGTLSLIILAPATNRAVAGFFLDDDFSPNAAFRVSVGFSDDGGNAFTPPGGLFSVGFYRGLPPASGALRTWKDAGDPTLPSLFDEPPCDPLGAADGPFDDPGCAILDNGPPSDPLDPTDPPRTHGLEAEVTPIDDFLQTQFGELNGLEWYFASGRPFLDFSYGRDSSALVAEALALDPSDEGPLVVTQNAQMDVPVLAIGGANGLTPEPKSFASYLGSIATPEARKEVHIIPGHAHLDVLTARDNPVVPLLEDFIVRVRQSKLLGEL